MLKSTFAALVQSAGRTLTNANLAGKQLPIGPARVEERPARN